MSDDQTPQTKETHGQPANPDLPEFEDEDGASDSDDSRPNESELNKNISAIHDVPVNVTAVLGKASMQVSQLLKLSRGAVVELDRKVGEAIDIYVNNRLVARGEVVIVDDQLGVTMTEIIKSDSAD